MTLTVRSETEQIEVTRIGLFPPYKADTSRKFISGLTTVYITLDGVELPPMTPDEFRAWKQDHEELFL